MPENPQDVVNRELREFNRHTGDGLPGEPANAPLPVGDPQSGVYNPKKAGLRKAILAPLDAMDGQVQAATEQADRAEVEAERSDSEADRAESAANTASGIASAFIIAENTFATKATAEAWHPVAAPDYIRTSGFTSAGDGGGALYRKVGSSEPEHEGKLVLELDDESTIWFELAENVVKPQMFGARGDGITDDGPAINSFWQYVSNTPVTAEFSGNFLTQEPIVMGRPDIGDPSPSTMVVMLNAQITTDYVDHVGDAVLIRRWRGRRFVGNLEVICGGDDVTSRRQRHGIVISDCRGTEFPRLSATGTRREAVRITSSGPGLPTGGNNNLVKVGYLHARFAGYCDDATIDSFTNSGSSESRSQTTVITPSTLPTELGERDFIRYKGEPYLVVSVDHNEGTFSVFPWLLQPEESDTFTYLVGGGLLNLGGDSNINQFDYIDVANSPCGAKLYGLYPPAIMQLHYARSNTAGPTNAGIGVALGGDATGVSQGGNILNFYVEGSAITEPQVVFQIVQTTNQPVSFAIGSMNAYGSGMLLNANFVTQYGLGARNLAGVPHAGQAKVSYNVQNTGGRFFGDSGSTPRSRGQSTLQAHNRSTQPVFYHRRANSQQIMLNFNDDINRLWGHDTIFVSVHGTGGNGQPTGTITFETIDGDSVNGGSSVSFSSLSTAGLWMCNYNYPTSNWIVTQIAG